MKHCNLEIHECRAVHVAQFTVHQAQGPDNFAPWRSQNPVFIHNSYISRYQINPEFLPGKKQRTMNYLYPTLFQQRLSTNNLKGRLISDYNV